MIAGCESCTDKLLPKGHTTYARCAVCGRDLSEPIEAPQTRSDQQNKAIHVFCELLAAELNNAGLDMKKVLKPEIDIPWTKDTIKEYIWRPVQLAQLRKESTVNLSTKEVSMVWETINRFLGEKHGVHVPFPTSEPDRPLV